ncbi:MAG: hypothetical protein ABI132_05260 [Rhodanobacteraceae bacterium]
MTGFLLRLKQRKLVQWAVAYVAAAFALLQGIDIFAQRFAWPDSIERVLLLAACVGFFVALVLAWYHGEKGAQRASTTELMILALLLAIGGALMWRFAQTPAIAPNHAVITPTASQVTPALAKIPAKSIAVLPFENLSDDKANAYFASGMQDEILTRLAGIHDLKVISRTSTEQYASHPPNLKIVAEQLGVATLLEGSVQRADGKVRINLQLIDAHSDSHLWAQNYDRDIADVFAVQSDVAEKVADALQAQLLPAESARIASVPTKSPEAHDLFLKGLDLFHQLRTSSALDPATTGKQAADLYRRAIAADPEFALAWAQLSYLQSYLHWYNVDPSTAVVDAARDAAEHALALQPNLPEAHLAMGYVHYWDHRDYAPALDEFTKALAGMPNSAEVLAAIGYVHRRQGSPTLGIPELQQAEVLDPRYSLVSREMANSYVMVRRYADADATYARSLAIFPGDIEAQVQRATARMFAGDFVAAERVLMAIPADMDPEASVSLLRARLALIQRQPDATLAVLAHAPDWLRTRWEHSLTPVGLLRGDAFAMKGEAALAHAAFVQAEQALQGELNNSNTSNTTTDALSYLGLVYAGLGQKDAALKSANAAVTRLPISHDPIDGAFQLERLARTEAQVGETSSAIDHLQQLMGSASGDTVSVATLKIDPAWDPLRKDPRFQKLVVDGEAAEKAQSSP